MPFGGDERARHRAQPPVEGELAEGGVAVERFRGKLVGGSEHRERDRQIETRPLLAQRGGCEVDGDTPLGRPLELGRGDAGADALLRLLTGAVGEPDDRECRQPLLQVCLDLDTARVDADERMGDRAGEHAATLGECGSGVCAGFVPRMGQFVHTRPRVKCATDGGNNASRSR